MMVKRILGVVLVAIALLASPASASTEVTSVAKQLVCQCGCTLTVANCTHGECMSRDAMTALIEKKLGEGMSESQVIKYFVSEYGEQVLASPTKKGFNLVAWILPFAVILVGAAIIWLALKKWVWQGNAEQPEATPVADTEDEKYKLRLEQELKRFGEGGYR